MIDLLRTYPSSASPSLSPAVLQERMVLRFVKEMMLDQPLQAKLLIVLKGKASKYFQHALCFVRRDFGRKDFGRKK